MKPVVTNGDALRRLFAALAENTFHVELGVADPPVIDYLSRLLVRFVRMETIFRVRDAEGRRLEEVAEMMIEAGEHPRKTQREIYRHIGDFTLFWSGVYPEALDRLQSADTKDHLLDYCQQGKRSYYLASTWDDEPYEEDAAVLRRLSQEFELCSFGLNRIRREWEKLPQEALADEWEAEQN